MLAAVAAGALLSFLADAASARSLEQQLCTQDGVRYVGSAVPAGDVCFTLTPDGTRLLEYAVDFVAASGCPYGATAATSTDFSLDPAPVTSHGAIEIDEGTGTIFVGNVDGDRASGVLENRESCGARKLRWTAHRTVIGKAVAALQTTRSTSTLPP